MANKGYYYLKLRENFFDTDELKVLEGMENGYLYSNILLKLYLKALKNEGKLTFNEFIPYDIKMLATITGHNIDIVDKAIKIFKGMGLIEILDNGTIYMLDMQKMIGSISSEGVRKAEYREKIKLEKENGTYLGQCPNIISNSNSNSILLDNNKEENKIKEEKHKYGEYNHVLLTAKELNRLKDEIGEKNTESAIKLLDEAIEMKGYKYKSHYLAIKKWVLTSLKQQGKWVDVPVKSVRVINDEEEKAKQELDEKFKNNPNAEKEFAEFMKSRKLDTNIFKEF